MTTDIPDCQDCLKLMVEDLAKSVADPEKLAQLEAEAPEEAAEIRASLRSLLNMPKASLPELAKALASRAKGRVGLLHS
jgi:hypothetical protein